MVRVRFFDAKGEWIGSMSDQTKDFPLGTTEIRMEGPLGDVHCGIVTKLLNQAPTMLKKITVDNITSTSPNYLAFLMASVRKTEILSLRNCINSAMTFSCLAGALVQPDGLTELEFFTFAVMDTPEVNTFLQGIASSPSLERLLFRAEFVELDSAGHVLVDALRQNRKLKTLEVFFASFDDETVIPNLLQAAILETKVETLTIYQQAPNRELSMNALADTVCRQDCRLKSLKLSGLVPTWPENNVPDYAIIPKNSSVKGLTLRSRSSPPLTQILQTVKLFSSLSSLTLEGNKLTDLTPLDDLLVGENASLQSLSVCGNNIDEQDMMTFLSKLPRMKLKNLDLFGNPFKWSKVCMAEVDKAIWLNTSLERVAVDAISGPIVNKPEYMVALNRGGRGAFQSDGTSEALPMNLWPCILERSQRIFYYMVKDKWGSPEEESLRIDVLYWLLREKVLTALDGMERDSSVESDAGTSLAGMTSQMDNLDLSKTTSQTLSQENDM